ncbi:MAG: PD40 domain-containing protein, partial [Proteobacteria bacterium]|nr:PD40 domain-containing protein [Pseudomonadota bacterium]
MSYDELYREVESFYRALHAPGQDCVTDGADLTVAADGRRGAFTATVFMDLASAPATRIAGVNLESGELTVRAAGAGNDRLPHFSPDGRLAFLSDRDQCGNFQLFVADPVSGDARACPPVDGVIESLAWSPDG